MASPLQTQLQTALAALNTAIFLEAAASAAIPILTVKSGDNLASLLASQTVDHTIYKLAPGATFTGPLPLTKPCTLTSDGPAVAPLRVSPSDPLATLLGAFTTSAPINLVNIALAGDASRGTILSAGDDLLCDRVFIRGNATGQHRGVQVNAKRITIRRCFIDNIFSDQDTQAIAGWDGTADLLIDDCYLESSGENVIFGGADASSSANIPQRIVLTNCDLSKRLSWKGVAGITIKNLLELKNATDVTIQRNRGTYSWLNGQDGYAVLLTVRNQEGTNPFATVARVKMLGNTWSHLGAGLQILAQDDRPGFPSVKMSDILLQDETYTDVDPSLWGGAGRQVFLAGGPKNLTLSNLSFSGLHLNTAFSFGDDPTLLCENLTVLGGLYQEGDYGIKAAGFAPGLPSLVARAPGYTWNGVTIQIGNPKRSDGATKGSIPYPPSTTVIP